MNPDWFVFGTSSGGTHAGLVLGARLFGYKGKVLGISIDESESWLQARVSALASEASELLGPRIDIRPDEILADDSYCSAGYGVLTQAEKEAVKLFARTEGLLPRPRLHGKGRGRPHRPHTQRFFRKGRIGAVLEYGRPARPLRRKVPALSGLASRTGFLQPLQSRRIIWRPPEASGIGEGLSRRFWLIAFSPHADIHRRHKKILPFDEIRESGTVCVPGLGIE